jgi:hypothetical protein
MHCRDVKRLFITAENPCDHNAIAAEKNGLMQIA